MRIRLRHLLRERDKRGNVGELVLSIYRDHGVVPKDDRVDNFNKTPEDLGAYKLVLPGDVVVNKMKAWQGSVAVSAHRGIVSGDYLVCEVVGRGVERRFLHHLLRSRPLIAQYAMRSSGIRPAQWRIYWDDFVEIPVDLPAPAMQVAIADYLDAETARIDAVIEKKRRFGVVLEERRAALIEATIGDGSSAVQYLKAEETPRRAAPMKRLLAGTIAGGTPDSDDSRFWCDEDVAGATPWLAIGDIVDRGETATSIKWVTSLGLANARLRVGPPGTLLFAMYASLGKLTVTSMPAVWNQAILGLVPSGGTRSSQFLALWLEALRPHLKLLARSSTQDNLNAEQVGLLPVPIYSPEAQGRIVADLDTRLSGMTAIQTRLGEQIVLLAEHRQALITAAVTGELAVPGAAAA